MQKTTKGIIATVLVFGLIVVAASTLDRSSRQSPASVVSKFRLGQPVESCAAELGVPAESLRARSRQVGGGWHVALNEPTWLSSFVWEPVYRLTFDSHWRLSRAEIEHVRFGEDRHERLVLMPPEQ